LAGIGEMLIGHGKALLHADGESRGEINVYIMLVDSLKREIETLTGQITDLKTENADLKSRLSLFAKGPPHTLGSTA